MYRIYYGTRNEHNQSSVGYADIDLDTLEVAQCDAPVLEPGPLGRFDDNGVLPSCAFADRLYYIGFKPGGTTRMQLLCGLAARAGHSFVPISAQPLVNNHVGIATAGWACGELFYYVHGIEWLDKDTPRYDIRVLDKGKITAAIPLKATENALARPYVLKTAPKLIVCASKDFYEMWFSAKGDTYRGQYATSDDGIRWKRRPYEFPEDEMAYPILIRHGGKEFMFFNRGYGEDGICLATR